ncbi:MAG: hypothetical protein ACKVRN_02415 [Pyrinomonadaceae bacterium]
MTELDQVWSELLDKAASKAHHQGHSDIAEYLRLKAANDAVRGIGVGWLIDTILEIAGQAVRQNAAITIEREEPHNFAHGNANMVGSLLRLSYGVRCLTVEAGWTRTPRDGIMKNGALALARITHFGMPKKGAEFRLVHGDKLPNWLNEKNHKVESNDLSHHIDVLFEI